MWVFVTNIIDLGYYFRVSMQLRVQEVDCWFVHTYNDVCMHVLLSK